MSSKEIVIAATDPVFYTRVCFLALRAAQVVAAESEDTPNHENRTNYALRILQGADNAILLTQHVVAGSPDLCDALENGTDVSDDMIEAALLAVWDARAEAYAPAPPPPMIPITT